jgi:hypothetical protein
MDCIYGAGIHTGAAVDTGIRIDLAFVANLADGIHRAGFVACPAVNALVGNGMSQSIHLLFLVLGIIV